MQLVREADWNLSSYLILSCSHCQVQKWPVCSVENVSWTDVNMKAFASYHMFITVKMEHSAPDLDQLRINNSIYIILRVIIGNCLIIITLLLLLNCFVAHIVCCWLLCFQFSTGLGGLNLGDLCYLLTRALHFYSPHFPYIIIWWSSSSPIYIFCRLLYRRDFGLIAHDKRRPPFLLRHARSM